MSPTEQLRHYIRSCSITPTHIGKLANVSGASMRALMTGKGTITLQTLDRIAEVLGLFLGKVSKVLPPKKTRGRPRKKEYGNGTMA